MTFNCRTTLLFLPSVSYLAMGNPSDWEPSELTCAQQENAAYAFRGARLLLPQGMTALRCPFLYRFDCRCAACIPLANTCRTRAQHRTRVHQISLDDKLEVANDKPQMQMRHHKPQIDDESRQMQMPSSKSAMPQIDNSLSQPNPKNTTIVQCFEVLYI